MKNISQVATREYVFLFVYQILNGEKNYIYNEEDLLLRIDDFDQSYREEDEEKSESNLALINRQSSLQLIKNCLSQTEQLCQRIESHLKKKTFTTLNKIEQSLVLLATSEKLNSTDLSSAVIITQYMKLAEKYATVNSSRFLNGVLDAIFRN